MKAALLLILTALLFSSCQSYSYTLDAVPDGTSAVSTDRGNELLTASSDNVTIMVTASPVAGGKEVFFTLGISNDSDSLYSFHDSQIEIFGGDSEKGEWRSLGVWSADAYYAEAESKAATREFWAAMSGAMAVISASRGEYSTSRIYSSSGRHVATVKSRTYDPSDMILASMWASANNAAVQSENRRTLSALRNNLLYSSDITSHQAYSGIIYAEANYSTADYKLVFTDKDGSQISFVFTRSDRKYVLNHWLDAPRERHSLILSHAVAQDKFNLSYHYSTSLVGAYTGLSLYGSFFRSGNLMDASYYPSSGSFFFNTDPDRSDSYSRYLYDASFNVTSVQSGFGMGQNFGVNFKILPYTWLDVGFEYGFTRELYYSGSLRYKGYNETVWRSYGNVTIKDGRALEFFIGPQIGLNFIVNMLDLHLMCSYMFITNRFYFDLGVGIAF